MIVVHDKTETVKIKIYDSMENKLEPTVGAWVRIVGRYGENVAQITKVNKSDFEADNRKFGIRTGFIVTADKWDTTKAVVISEQRLNELMLQYKMMRLAKESKSLITNAIQKLSNENLIKVAEYIKSLEK